MYTDSGVTGVEATQEKNWTNFKATLGNQITPVEKI